MHRPPAVSFQVVRSRWHLGFILTCSLLCALNLAFWMQVQHSNLSRFLVFAVAGVAFALALRAWWSTPTGRLGWDGESWFWSGFGDVALSRLSVVIDLQWVALVRIRGEDGQSNWLWLESRCFDARWLAVRRALVASA
jgi:hypothetical protein